MAYIPPNKRHSKDAEKPSPFPDSLIPSFNRSLHLGTGRRERAESSRRRCYGGGGGGKIVYAPHSVSRWLIAGGGGLLPASSRLQPVSCEIFERRSGGKPLVLVAGGDPPAGSPEERPWASIAERIGRDLPACAQSARSETASEDEEIKLSFLARFGKVFFQGDPLVCLSYIRSAAAAESDIPSQVYKSFYTNVPDYYMEEIRQSVIPKLGFNFDSEKEHYHVKVFDKRRPHSTIACKCIVTEGGELKIYKAEFNVVRHLVSDISCLYRDVDLRLMLATKRILKILSDEEDDGLGKLITSAVQDPDVKGGLRWPLGKKSVGERFSIGPVWHTKYRAYKNQTMRLKLRHVDRFDHMSNAGEVADEVTLKLSVLSKHLRDSDLDISSLTEMVQEATKLIWDHFLCYDHSPC